MNASGTDMTYDPFNILSLQAPRYAFDGDGDDGGDDGGDGDKGGSDKGDAGGSSSGGTTDGDKGDKGAGDGDGSADDDDKQARSREAAKYRTERNAERQRAEAAEAELEKLRRKERSDLENAQKDRDTFKGQAEQLATEVTGLKVKVALFESGALNEFVDPSDAGRYLDFSEFVDDDGQVKSTDLKKKIEDLRKEKGYLFKSKDGDGSGDEDKTPSGSKPKGRGQSNDEGNRQKLEEKFPALRR